VDAVQFERWARANFGSGHLAAVGRQRARDVEAFKRETTLQVAQARSRLYASKRAAPTASGTRSREADTPPPRDLEALKRWASITTARARAGVHGPTRFARQSSRPASTAAQPTAAAIELAAARKAKLDQVRRRRLGWRADTTRGTWSVEAGGQTFKGQFT
jgi:hypothetical protein